MPSPFEMQLLVTVRSQRVGERRHSGDLRAALGTSGVATEPAALSRHIQDAGREHARRIDRQGRLADRPPPAAGSTTLGVGPTVTGGGVSSVTARRPPAFVRSSARLSGRRQLGV